MNFRKIKKYIEKVKYFLLVFRKSFYLCKVFNELNTKQARNKKRKYNDMAKKIIYYVDFKKTAESANGTRKFEDKAEALAFVDQLNKLGYFKATLTKV